MTSGEKVDLVDLMVGINTDEYGARVYPSVDAYRTEMLQHALRTALGEALRDGGYLRTPAERVLAAAHLLGVKLQEPQIQQGKGRP